MKRKYIDTRTDCATRCFTSSQVERKLCLVGQSKRWAQTIGTRTHKNADRINRKSINNFVVKHDNHVVVILDGVYRPIYI